MADESALLTSLYDALSRQDVDGVMSYMHAEIDWPNTFDGGRIKGLEAMRAYWIRQFGVIRPTVSPIEITRRPDGSVIVKLVYAAHALDGRLWEEEVRGNLFRFKDGLIVFGDWVEPPA
ncbi:MAG: nuclear transport factor 2 family protein [Caulobacter sp.]|nr:nuclear transport factor 2 family protein [Caulobacter sp.]